MPLFLDACALAKRYVYEGRSTQTMKEITGRPAKWGGLIVSRLVEIETVSAITHAIRGYTFGVRTEALARLPGTVAKFRTELASGAFTIIENDEEIVESAIQSLVTNPTDEIGAGDAIHLAAALAAREDAPDLIFVTADGALFRAAKARGLSVFNPLFADQRELERQLAPSKN